MKPHSYAHIKAYEYLKSAATCTAKAVYYTSCTECGRSSEGTADEATFEYGNALGHKYGEWVSNGDGTHTRVCANDNKHTETKNCHGGKATCTAKAICEDCGKAYGEMTAHTFTAKTASAKYLKSAATCTAKAVYYTSCADCGLSSKGTKNEATFEYGNALGHKYGKWVSNGDGTHTRVCANDNKHTETKDCHGGKATCTAKAICEDCGKAYGEMTAHTFTAKTASDKYLKSAATCTAKAVYYTSCADCGLSSKGTKNEATFEGEALGHSFDKWSITAPTCTEDGYRVRKCTRCDATETEVIPATGHKYVDTVIKPTYTEKGYTIHKCLRCDSSYKDSYTDVLVLAKISGLRTVSRTDTTANLSWNKNPDADGYIIEQYSGSRWMMIGKITRNSTVSFTAKTLAAGSTNKLRARAYKGTAYSAYIYLNINTVPSAITGFTLKSATSSTLNVAWNRNISGDGYILERSEGTKWVSVAKVTNHATLNSTVKSLKAGTAYKFRIRAYKSFGSVTFYSSYTYLTAVTKPAAMSGVKVKSKTNNTVVLQWNKNTSADCYYVEQYKGSKWTQMAKINSNGVTSFTVRGLSASTTYKFRVKAGRLGGYSSYTYITVTTKPSATTGMRAKTVTTKSVTLQWNKNTSAGGYSIEKYDGAKWVQVKRYTSNANTTYTAGRLKAGTTYKFRMRSFKTTGKVTEYSAYSYCKVTTKK